MFPEQNIPEAQKDRPWAIKCVKSIVEMAFTNPYAKYKDQMCYNIVNGVIDENFDYLTKVKDNAFPAKFRFIPLLKPRLDRLQTDELQKPFVFRVMTVDKESLTEKKDAAIQQILALSKALYAEKISRGQQALAGMQKQSEQNPELQQQFAQTAEQINAQMRVTKDDMDKISAALKVRPGDLREMIMYKGLSKYITQTNLRELFNTSFMDLCTTDKEYFQIDYPGNGRDPVVKLLRVQDFWHSADSDTDYVDECEMACYREHMTPTRLLDEFGDELKKTGDYDYVTGLRSAWSLDTSDIFPNERMFIQADLDSCSPSMGLYAGSELMTNTIDVWRTEWRSCRGNAFKVSPNKYNEELPFIHHVKDADKEVLRDGEEITKRYMNDVWRGCQIGNGIYAGLGKRKWQVRHPDNPSRVSLSFTGPSYGRRQRKPNSIVWMTKDIQVLYCLLFYHHELWMALAGVKGAVMDRSQKPSGMSDEEWLYQRKMGTMWIQSVNAGGRQISSFNQFQTFDDSLPPTVIYLREMMVQLEDMVSLITGVSRQRLGQTKKDDSVGGNEQSVFESNMVTGMLFYRHDRIKRRVLTQLANLCAIAWEDGKTIIGSDNPDDIIDIPPGLVNTSYYEAIMEDSLKQEKILNDIRTIGVQDHQKGMIPLADVIKLYTIDSIKELELTVSKMQEIAEKKGSDAADAQAERDRMLKEMDASVKKQAVDTTAMLGQMKGKLDEAKMQIEASLKARELEQAEAASVRDDETKRVDIASERAIEMDYLKQQVIESSTELALEKEKIDLEREQGGKKNNQQSAPKKPGVGTAKPEASRKKATKEKIKD